MDGLPPCRQVHLGTPLGVHGDVDGHVPRVEFDVRAPRVPTTWRRMVVDGMGPRKDRRSGAQDFC